MEYAKRSSTFLLKYSTGEEDQITVASTRGTETVSNSNEGQNFIYISNLYPASLGAFIPPFKAADNRLKTLDSLKQLVNTIKTRNPMQQ